MTLPLVWFLLTYVLYPPEVPDVERARAIAREQLAAEGELDPRGKRVAAIFAVTAGLWMLGGLGDLFEPYLSSVWMTTVFGGEGMTVFGVEGHQGLLYYVMVGVAAIPALVLADTMEWEELVDIDWGTLLLFGGGISLANALADTGATEWIADTVFGGLVGAPIVLVIGAVVLLVVFLTEMTSNSATTSIIVPILISLGSVFSATLGLTDFSTALFLSVAGTIAASFAFALPVATPPNAIVFGSGYVEQRHMLRAGLVLNAIMTVVLTGIIWRCSRSSGHTCCGEHRACDAVGTRWRSTRLLRGPFDRTPWTRATARRCPNAFSLVLPAAVQNRRVRSVLESGADRQNASASTRIATSTAPRKAFEAWKDRNAAASVCSK